MCLAVFVLLVSACASSSPDALPSAKAKDIAVGSNFACALTTEGAVRCWGYSEKGQIGNGAPFGQSTLSSVPVQVTGLTSGALSIAAGVDVACAVTGSGGVKCWGANDFGQLGTGMTYADTTTQASNVPVDVLGITSGATAVSVGAGFSCAIVAGGAVKCWGADSAGELGNNSQKSPGDDQPEFQPPVDVVGLTGAVEISVGGSHACAVLGTGALYCWGDNSSGQLGIMAEDAQSPVPVQVTALGTDVVHVTAGEKQTCAILKSGALECWGDGDAGLLGDGMTGSFRIVRSPQPVIGATTGVTSAALGNFACAVIGGATRCWGASAELGSTDPSGYETYAPGKEAVGLGAGSSKVGVGARTACTLTTEGAIECWGDNGAGELGNGADTNGGSAREDNPVAVLSFP